MRDISAANQAALSARSLMARDFLWIVAKDPANGYADVSVGFWSDLANITALVVDPDTGLADLRPWIGAGSLIQISDIPSVAQISTETVTVDMSQLAEQVEIAVRQYHIKQARVEIFRGLLDPTTGQLVAPAQPRFVGYVDEVQIVTPSAGEDGMVRLTLASHSQELLRSNPATRSHEDQLTRSSGDRFFVDAAVVGDWGPFQWGPEQVQQETQKKSGLFGWGGVLGFL